MTYLAAKLWFVGLSLGAIQSMLHFGPENKREINRFTPSTLARGVKWLISREFEGTCDIDIDGARLNPDYNIY